MMNFKIQAFFTTLIIGSVSALTISDAISQKVNAQATPSCNNATIKGSYGVTFSGTGRSGGLIARVGLIKLDGKGNFQVTFTASSSSGTIDTNQTYSGTYSVKQDCTVQIVYSDSDRSTASGVIVDGGKEIFLITTYSGSVITGTWKKVN